MTAKRNEEEREQMQSTEKPEEVKKMADDTRLEKEHINKRWNKGKITLFEKTLFSP